MTDKFQILMKAAEANFDATLKTGDLHLAAYFGQVIQCLNDGSMIEAAYALDEIREDNTVCDFTNIDGNEQVSEIADRVNLTMSLLNELESKLTSKEGVNRLEALVPLKEAIKTLGAVADIGIPLLRYAKQ